MKHLDKLILKSFAGPFFLTFIVVVFILLNRQLLFYYDDIIGKGLEWTTLGELISYFAVFMLPQALPLAVLLSSLITFGNLAEHGELTAIKCSGISLLRVLLPIGFVVILLTLGAFYLNNYIVPQTALKAYSLLYDIKQKKPTLDLREGVFYNGLPNVSIKVNQKFAEDEAALKDVILYDHKNPDKGHEVWVADSGRMYTIHNDQFLKFELYRGYRYQDGSRHEIDVNTENPIHSKNPAGPENPDNPELMSRTAFGKTEFVFDLSSFGMLRSDPKIFGNHRMMKSRSQLLIGIDSIQRKIDNEKASQKEMIRSLKIDDRAILEKIRDVKQHLSALNENIRRDTFERVGYEVQRHRIATNAVACFIMFLIGAPLGSIIRKGGLGLPVLLSIAFFLIYFVVDIQAEELAQTGTLPVVVCMWMANIALLLVGVYFLVIARNDSRLFDPDLQRTRIEKVTLRAMRVFKRPALNSF